MRGPIVDSRAGSRVSTTATLTSGMSMPPMPMLRRNGTGTTSSATRLIATVTPEASTACPAVFMATTTAMAEMALVIDISGVCSSRETRRITPRPINEIRNWTTKLTSLKVVSPSTSKNVVRMETAAISNGRNAKNDAKTKSSTRRAPAAPSRVSASTLGPWVSPPTDSMP